MPPKNKFSREEIIAAAVAITRREGFAAVTARAVGAELGSSSKVIFSLFQNMEELAGEVIAYAYRLYHQYLSTDFWGGQFPPFKTSGLAYIRFAKEEKELFRLLFMRDRREEKITDDPGELEPMIQMIMQSTGLSHDRAYLFHLEMWVYAHGIATMLATDYLPWQEDMISAMLTDAFEGMKLRYRIGEP